MNQQDHVANMQACRRILGQSCMHRDPMAEGYTQFHQSVGDECPWCVIADLRARLAVAREPGPCSPGIYSSMHGAEE